MAEPTTTSIGIWSLVKNFSYVVAMFVGLNPESYGILGLFMILDTATGVIRAGTIHGWSRITSHKLSVGILAKCTLILVPMLLALAGHAVGLNINFIAKSTLNILILAELYSVLSNIQSIRLGKDIQEFDALNFVLLKLRDGLEKTIKRK